MDKIGFCQIGGMTILTDACLDKRLKEIYHDDTSKEQQKFKIKFEEYLSTKLAQEQIVFIDMLFKAFEKFKTQVAEIYSLGVIDNLYGGEKTDFGYNDTMFETLIR